MGSYRSHSRQSCPNCHCCWETGPGWLPALLTAARSACARPSQMDSWGNVVHVPTCEMGGFKKTLSNCDISEMHELIDKIIHAALRSLTKKPSKSNFYKMISAYHGSSVGSQQTRQTLQVKHMALSSPVEAGCGRAGEEETEGYKNWSTIRSGTFAQQIFYYPFLFINFHLLLV